MKKILFATTTALMLFSCGQSADNANNGEGNEEDKVELGKNYGPVEVDIEKAVSVEDMLAKFEGQSDEMEFTLEADINEVCSKAGCWINIDKGDGETFMVRFKDHFTIPTETEVGTGAFMHGTAFWDTVSVEWQRHFIEDAGGTEEEMAAITEPKATMGFIADGIVLKK